MDKWEYRTQFMRANEDFEGVKDYAKKKHSDIQPKRFSPILMSKALDELGEQGWELVHMEPIQMLGEQGDVGFSRHAGGLMDRVWSNTYFCVFKRRKDE